jgi:hypothetical protein
MPQGDKNVKSHFQSRWQMGTERSRDFLSSETENIGCMSCVYSTIAEQTSPTCAELSSAITPFVFNVVVYLRLCIIRLEKVKGSLTRKPGLSFFNVQHPATRE